VATFDDELTVVPKLQQAVSFFCYFSPSPEGRLL
jgi:hypothetical protein